MTKKIIFLCNINRALKQIEQEIIDRAIACLEIAESKLKGKDAFTTDYEVRAKVAYYIESEDDPVHRYHTPFHYDTIVLEKDYGLLLDQGMGTDCYRMVDMPELDKPYCYLMHDLMDHSHVGDKIYEIDGIWVDLIYTDQKGIKINKDGSWRKLKLDEEEGFI